MFFPLKIFFPTRRELFLVALCSAIVVFFLLTTQTQLDLDKGDTAWYLERGRLLLRGDPLDQYIYNSAYSFLVGTLDVLLGNLLASAQLVTGLFGVAFGVALYTLATILFNRPVAIITLLLMGVHPYFFSFTRQMQTMLPYTTLLLGVLIVLLAFIQNPTRLRMVGLGLATGMMSFVRLDGAMYGILIAIGSVWVLGATRHWRNALGYFVLGVACWLIGVGGYLLLFSQFPLPAGGQQHALDIIRRFPNPLPIFSSEWALNITNVIALWATWAWVIVIWAVTQRKKNWQYILFLGGIAGFHWVMLFLLVQQTYGSTAVYYMPLVAYSAPVMAWGIWSVGERVGIRAVAWGLTLILVSVNLSQAWQDEPLVIPFTYQQESRYQAIQAFDAWWETYAPREAFLITSCPHLIFYSSHTAHYIFRFGHLYHNATLSNSPVNVLPRLYASGGMFVFCGVVHYQDWSPLVYEGQSLNGYRLETVFKQGDVYGYQVRYEGE